MAELNWLQAYAAEEVVEQAAEGLLTRREMMTRLAAICGTPALAVAFLASCSNSAATGAGSSSSASSAAGTAGAGSGAAATSTGASTATTATTATTTTSTTGSTSSASSANSTSTAAPSTSVTSGGSSGEAASGGAVLSVAADDPAVTHAAVSFPGPAGTLFGEIARPAGGGAASAPRHGVLVIHEIFGLTDHIRDVTRRLAKAGYVALAVDLASRAGGSDKAGNVAGALTQGAVSDRVADLDGGLAYLMQQPDFDGKLGVVGFCFGGGMTLSYAAAQPKVLAAVPYYGPTPQPASVMQATNAAILAQYGADDARVNAGIAALEEAMAGKTFEKRVWAGAGHAFNNDTRGAYVESVAVPAWQATLDWFATHLV